MPLYTYECPECTKEYDFALPMANSDDATFCPKCKCEGKKIIALRSAQPSFSDKMFPYYDQALMQRFESSTQRKDYLKKNGLEERGNGSMSKRQEQELMKYRGRKDLGGFAYED